MEDSLGVATFEIDVFRAKKNSVISAAKIFWLSFARMLALFHKITHDRKKVVYYLYMIFVNLHEKL